MPDHIDREKIAAQNPSVNLRELDSVRSELAALRQLGIMLPGEYQLGQASGQPGPDMKRQRAVSALFQR